jgi:hypothetical protein
VKVSSTFFVRSSETVSANSFSETPVLCLNAVMMISRLSGPSSVICSFSDKKNAAPGFQNPWAGCLSHCGGSLKPEPETTPSR